MAQVKEIYVIRCNTTGKCYVGSADNMWRRFGTHLLCLPHDDKEAQEAKPIYRDMYTIGVENFSLSLLERFDCDSEEESRKHEQHWIDVCNALAPNGYNLIRAHKDTSYNQKLLQWLNERKEETM